MLTMFRWLCVLAAAAGAAARGSPHAAYVDMLQHSPDAARYSSDVFEDAKLDVPGLIAKYGYPVEVHRVVTSDGYILEAHRIPHGRAAGSKPGGTPVLLMHGLLSSSADFLTMGPGGSLGYHLADAGFDVWLGNARGNYYSRRHHTLDPEEKDFWRFSWDEIGNYDLPALIDLALKVSGRSQLHYVGHSQGGTAFLVLTSLRPEYNDKVISFQGLAPASYFTHTENTVFKLLSPLENVLETAAFASGVVEIFSSRQYVSGFMERHCRPGAPLRPLCRLAALGMNTGDYSNSTMLPVILGHTPAGASIRQLAHYGQVIRFDNFRRYNYNLLTNLAVYGRPTPPEYDLSLITVPTYLHYGMADRQVHYKDILKLADNLPNVKMMHKAERESFNHFDFIWATDATEQIYHVLVEAMDEAEK